MGSGSADWFVAIMMLAAFALAIGGIRLVRTRATRTRGWLMIVCALVLIGNAAILTIPV